MKKQINIRASALTHQQITKLKTRTGMSTTELISVAVDRMARQEALMSDRIDTNDLAQAIRFALEYHLPLWDTRRLNERYIAGWLTLDEEDTPANEEWEQLDIFEELQ